MSDVTADRVRIFETRAAAKMVMAQWLPLWPYASVRREETWCEEPTGRYMVSLRPVGINGVQLYLTEQGRVATEHDLDVERRRGRRMPWLTPVEAGPRWGDTY